MAQLGPVGAVSGTFGRGVVYFGVVNRADGRVNGRYLRVEVFIVDDDMLWMVSVAAAALVTRFEVTTPDGSVRIGKLVGGALVGFLGLIDVGNGGKGCGGSSLSEIVICYSVSLHASTCTRSYVHGCRKS